MNETVSPANEGGEGRPHRIAVVGGGAGGLELAIRLARWTRAGGRARVTLIDRRAAHIWKPRLHEIAAGLLSASEEAASFAAQGRRHGFDFVLGEVERVDPEQRRVHLAAMAYPADDPVARAADHDFLPAREIAYDTAVLAMGSTVNDFGIPGVAEHSYTLNTPAGAERLHRALLAAAERVAAGAQKAVQVVIVGAGTTGVELAGELRDAADRLAQFRSLMGPPELHLTLVEMADRLLPQAPDAMARYAHDRLARDRVVMRLGAKVVEVEAGAVRLKDGGRLDADIVVWASGVKARQLDSPLAHVGHGSHGRLTVDPQLRVLREDGRAVDGLYAIGDVAAPPMAGGGVAPATAQAAHQQATLLARSLARQLRGRPALDFRYRDKGTLVSLGGGAAVGDLASGAGRRMLEVTGLGAQLAYTALYQGHLMELYGPLRTGVLALSGALRRSASPTAKLYW